MSYRDARFESTQAGCGQLTTHISSTVVHSCNTYFHVIALQSGSLVSSPYCSHRKRHGGRRRASPSHAASVRRGLIDCLHGVAVHSDSLVQACTSIATRFCRWGEEQSLGELLRLANHLDGHEGRLRRLEWLLSLCLCPTGLDPALESYWTSSRPE